MRLQYQKIWPRLKNDSVNQNMIIASTLIIISIATIYCLLLALYHGPLNAFWSSDHGVKLFQIQSLILNKFQSNALSYPGGIIDVENRFTPFRGQYLVHNGQTYGMFSQTFAVISAIPFFFFGYPGLYIIPLVSSLGILLVFIFLGQRFLKPIVIISGTFCLGLASPLVFYATNFWEHTPATLLILLGMLFSVIALTKNNLLHSFLSGVMIALATSLRNELILFVPTVILSMFMMRKSNTLKHNFAFGTGTTLGILPLLIFNQFIYGTFLGAHVSVAGTGVRLQIMKWAEMLILPINPIIIPFIFTLIVIISLFERWMNRQHMTFRWIKLGLIILLIIQCTASLDTINLTSLITAFPFALLALAPEPSAYREKADQNLEQHEKIITYIQRIAIIFVLLCWFIRLPDGGAQHGPRILLPVMPLFLLVGLWKVEQWFKYRKDITSIVIMVIAITSITQAALIAQADGLKNYQYVVSRNHEILTAAAQSNEQVIITDTIYTPLLIAPLVYDHRLVFMVETGKDLDDLIIQLKKHNSYHFYYLGVLPPEITETSLYWNSLEPLTERSSFAHRLRGQSFQIPPK